VNAHPHDNDGESGTVYVLHFDPPYRHAGHYIGWAQDADARIAQHLAGAGSPLVRAAVRAGSRVRVAATFAGSRYLERRLKRWHNTTARVCPICRVRRAGSAAAGPADEGVCQVPGPTVRDRL
jgi:predicted GIY-YIG superfamily endonuclease